MNYYTEIKAIKETSKGTQLIVEVPGEFLTTKINRFITNGKLDAELRINDGRRISNEQRRKIFALIKDISLYTGDAPDYLRQHLMYSYCISEDIEPFSLSNCSMEIARNYITYIIDFVLRWNIPLSQRAINLTDNTDKYLYGCIKYRRCSITGQANADIHHIEAIGMGANRKKVDHTKYLLIALNRDWHRKVHEKGNSILKKYGVYGIYVDAQTLKELGISIKEIQEDREIKENKKEE